MNIDSHQHFWRYNPGRDGWITEEMAILKRDFLPEDLIPELHSNQIDGCIAVQADQSEHETMFLLNLAAEHSEIKGVVGWVNLCSSDLPQRLEYFSQFEKLRGFRHVAQSEPDDRFLVREDFIRGISQLRAFRFTYDILIYPSQLPAATELVEKLPEQKFVLDHMAKPFIREGKIQPWAKHIHAIAANPNVYCKASGLVTEADWHNLCKQDFKSYLDIVFEAFGPDRMMFGSDWPVCLLAGTYESVKALLANYIRDFPADQQKKILGLNAVSFYGLKALSHEPATAR
jgi:L-fuconolactonase